MRVLRATDHKVMPWKNGGGTTTEIAVSPAGAGLDAFDWRVSMASVSADGPFSAFPGIDRILSVLDGGGIELDIEGADHISLTQASGPHSFPADMPTHGRLLDGPILDLNVMTRRTRYEAGVVPITLNRPMELRPEAETILIFVKSGSVAFGDAATLNEHDCLWLEAGDAVTISSVALATIFLIDLRRA